MAFFSIKKKKNYNERANQIERYIMKNKLFLTAALVTVIVLIASNLKNNEHVKVGSESNNTSESEVISESDVQQSDEKDATGSIAQDLPHWRFYYTDLWVLLVGGAVCTFNIIRERRKAKESLQ